MTENIHKDKLEQIKFLFKEVGGNLVEKHKSLEMIRQSDELVRRIPAQVTVTGFMAVMAEAAIAEERELLRVDLRRTIQHILKRNPNKKFGVVVYVAQSHMLMLDEPDSERRLSAQQLFSVLLNVNPKHSSLHAGVKIPNKFFGMQENRPERDPQVIELGIVNYMRWLKAKEIKKTSFTSRYEKVHDRFRHDDRALETFFNIYLQHAFDNSELFTDKMAERVIESYQMSVDPELQKVLKNVALYMGDHVSMKKAVALNEQVVMCDIEMPAQEDVVEAVSSVPKMDLPPSDNKVNGPAGQQKSSPYAADVNLAPRDYLSGLRFLKRVAEVPLPGKTIKKDYLDGLRPGRILVKNG